MVSAAATLKISNYHKMKGIGVGKCITSSIFSVGGYNWCLDYYPDGKTEDCKDYMSLFIRLRSAVKRRIKAEIGFVIVDRAGYPSRMQWKKGPCHLFSNDSSNNAHGALCFVKRSRIEYSKKYFQDGCFFIECKVVVVKPSLVKLRVPNQVAVPPRNLGKQLYQFLKSKDGTDIAFDVGGKTFHAHSCVLAARSPVFRADLFGPMKKSRLLPIKVDDMEVPVFEVSLRFIYSDSITEVETVMKNSDTAMMGQHLLVVADRYGVERLKIFCESKLYEDMQVYNVETTLALAEQHNCSQLKKACLNFISPPETLAAVVQTDGFQHLNEKLSIDFERAL